jgi:cell division GTPase FtsZ
MEDSWAGLKELSKVCDTTVVVMNDKLLELSLSCLTRSPSKWRTRSL